MQPSFAPKQMCSKCDKPWNEIREEVLSLIKEN